MKLVDPQRVFPPPSRAKSPFKSCLNPSKLCTESLEQIEHVATIGDMTKAEVVRYCIEYALANANWQEAATLKKRFRVTDSHSSHFSPTS